MGAYDRAIATAKRIIAAKGESCIWHVSDAPITADATKPWIEAPAAVPTQHAGTFIAFFPLDRKFSELIRFLKGTEVVTGSLYGLMSAVAFEPKLSDVVERKNGAKLGIFSLDPLAPNGDIILYTIEFRAGA